MPRIDTHGQGKVPIRSQRLLMRFLSYSITAVHVPDEDMMLADTLSRASLNTSATKPYPLGQDIHVLLSVVLNLIPR